MPLNGRFPYQKLIKYPHIKPEDIAVWERFIDANPGAYKTVDYDFGLSQVEEIAKTANALDIGGAERLYQYKADVVAYGNSEIHIIELKSRAGPGTIGQIKSYKTLFDRDEKPDKPTRAVIIASDKTPELDTLAKMEGVTLIII